jgi:membrane-associated phospholipid phosphatase
MLVRVVADLGRGGVAWVALVLAARPRARAGPGPSATSSVAAVWGSFLASVLLARLVGRDRPCQAAPFVRDDCPEGPGFPSDQAAAAFAGALIVGSLVPSARLPALAVAAGTSLARVRLGYHRLSDVAGGALLGTVGAKIAGG